MSHSPSVCVCVSSGANGQRYFAVGVLWKHRLHQWSRLPLSLHRLLLATPPPRPSTSEALSSYAQEGSPPCNKRHLPLILHQGDRGTDGEVEELQLIPLIQGGQKDSSVKRWSIRGLRRRLVNRPVALFEVIAAGWDTDLCLCIVEHTLWLHHANTNSTYQSCLFLATACIVVYF